MRTIKVIIFVLGVAVVLCGSTAKADLLNGGFEDGLALGPGILDLSGWTAIGADPYFVGGPAAVDFEMSRDWINPAPDWFATEGTYFASLWSTDSMGTDFSTLSQTFDAPAGYLLEFDYFFDYGDYVPFYDTTTAILSSSGGSVVLFEHNTPGYELGDEENIGWTTISYALPATDTYTLEFAIADFDGMYESILGVDNVSVVPLPSALVLGSLGLGVAGSLVGKFQRRRKP